MCHWCLHQSPLLLLRLLLEQVGQLHLRCLLLVVAALLLLLLPPGAQG
jgi:hypothetical protein